MLVASLTACSALLAGCGSDPQPRLPRADAARLTVLAQRIAGEGACRQRTDIATLRKQAVRLVDARRVPAALRRPLLAGVDALDADMPLCVPSVPKAPAPPPAPQQAPPGRPHPPGPPHGPHFPGPPHALHGHRWRHR